MYINEQLECACLGVASHVSDLQTTSGVKDGLAQFWIDNLITRARDMQAAQPRRDHTDIQKELICWVRENEDKIMNPSLTLRGKTLRV